MRMMVLLAIYWFVFGNSHDCCFIADRPSSLDSDNRQTVVHSLTPSGLHRSLKGALYISRRMEIWTRRGGPFLFPVVLPSLLLPAVGLDVVRTLTGMLSLDRAFDPRGCVYVEQFLYTRRTAAGNRHENREVIFSNACTISFVVCLR